MSIQGIAPSHTAIIAGRLSRQVELVLQGVQKWHQTRKTRHILEGLSDAALEDIGVTRAEIARLR